MDESTEVVLASASPQRREMLERLGIEFSVEVSGVEEITHGDPKEVVLANALLKARSASRSGVLTIGCDTDVVVEGHLIGKPEDEMRAHEYLAQLSGRTHEVVSGLALLGPEDDRVRTGTVETRVTFRPLEVSEIGLLLSLAPDLMPSATGR
jgi:septum formation protein